MTPAEAAKNFFQGAMHMWTSAPDFKGIESSMSLNEWFDASLREHLPTIARKRGADAYIGLLRGQVELAYQQLENGDIEAGRDSMVELLNLIHTYLHLPSKHEVNELIEKSKQVKQ